MTHRRAVEYVIQQSDRQIAAVLSFFPLFPFRFPFESGWITATVDFRTARTSSVAESVGQLGLIDH